MITFWREKKNQKKKELRMVNDCRLIVQHFMKNISTDKLSLHIHIA